MTAKPSYGSQRAAGGPRWSFNRLQYRKYAGDAQFFGYRCRQAGRDQIRDAKIGSMARFPVGVAYVRDSFYEKLCQANALHHFVLSYRIFPRLTGDCLH